MMGTIFDLLGSLIFGGALFVIILNANESALEIRTVSHGDMLVQRMLVDVAQAVEGEFRNMGFGVAENSPSILAADSASITFLMSLDRTSTHVDTIKYILGPTSDLAGTQNELDRNLYREVNGGGRRSLGAVTIFGLRYYTRGGDTLDTPVDASRLTEIHVVEVTLEVQNPYAPYRPKWAVKNGQRDALYSQSLWQQTRLASQNSRR